MTLVMPEPDFDVGRVWDSMGEAKLVALIWTVARGEQEKRLEEATAEGATAEAAGPEAVGPEVARPEEARPEEEEGRHMRSSTLMKRRQRAVSAADLVKSSIRKKGRKGT